MGSIDALAKAIKEFSGGVVIVSHDFRLISQVAEQLWEVKGKKIVDLSRVRFDSFPLLSTVVVVRFHSLH